MQEEFLRRCQEVSESDNELDVIVHEPEIEITEPVKTVETARQVQLVEPENNSKLTNEIGE